MKKFRCLVYSWEDVYRMCVDLARKIRDSGFRPDAIVAIARGGWVPARIIADVLFVKELYSVKAEHWGIVATETGKAKITHPLTADVRGKSVLVVDDVADTGETVKIVADHVLERGAKDVRTAVIDFKHTSRYVPDYYAREMKEWMWIVYPWSVYEDARDLINRIGGDMDVDTVLKRLEEEYGFKVDREVIEDLINAK